MAPDASMKLGQNLANQSVEFRRLRRLPLKKRFVVLPNRGLVGGSAVLLLLLPMYLMLEKPDSMGIYVAINAQSGRTPDDYCIAGPIVVSVLTSDASTKVFLNGSEIRRKDLPHVLRTQLAARANWEVFVEASDLTSYSDAVDAIDQIRSLGAKSVLLTPKLKEKLAEECSIR